MAYGFQRITELSSLGLKTLNDQLEMLWVKAMGGVSYNESSGELENIVDTIKDGNNIGTYFAQKDDCVKMAAGAVGINNLLKNGDATGGVKHWTVENGTLTALVDTYELNREVFELRGSSVVVFRQTSIVCNPAVKHTLSFKGMLSYPAVKVTAYVRGKKDGTSQYYEHKQITVNQSANFADYYISFETYTDESELEVIFSAEMADPYALFYVTDIQIKEGGALSSFSKNNEEQKTNVFMLKKDGLYANVNGMHVQMTNTDGDTSLLIEDNNMGAAAIYSPKVCALGRTVYENGTNIYVSLTGSDMNPGTQSSPVRTIQKAISLLPLISDNTVNVYIAYGEYFEDVFINGLHHMVLNIYGNNAIINGRIQVFCEGRVYLERVRIRTSEAKPCLHALGAGLTILAMYCVFDNVNKNSHGIICDYGAHVQVNSSGFYNCNIVIYVYALSLVYICALTGSNNNCAFYCMGGTIMGTDTYPESTTLKYELKGGKILYDYNVSKTSSPPLTNVMTNRWEISSTGTCSYTENKLVSDSDAIAKGKIKAYTDALSEPVYGAERTGLWFFYTESITGFLSQNTVYGAKFTVRRARYGGDPQPVLVAFFLHNAPDINSTQTPTFYDTGIRTKIAWGQEESIFLPADIVELLRNGTYKGIAAKALSDDEQAVVFCPQSEYAAKLMFHYR